MMRLSGALTLEITHTFPGRPSNSLARRGCGGRTAEAFAQRLIADGTVKGFPEDCISADNSPIAGLEEALATSIGTPGSRERHDWMCGYCDGLRLPERHAD